MSMSWKSLDFINYYELEILLGFVVYFEADFKE